MYNNDLPDDRVIPGPARRHSDPINELLIGHQQGDRGVFWEDDH